MGLSPCWDATRTTWAVQGLQVAACPGALPTWALAQLKLLHAAIALVLDSMRSSLGLYE